MDIKDMNVNSSNNQTIKGKFVGREVITCVSATTDYILQQNDVNAPFNWEDVENYFIDNSDEIEEILEEIDNKEGKISELEEEISDIDDSESPDNKKIDILEYKIEKIQDDITELEDKISELEQEQDYPNEVYEWWEVSSYLLRKLKEKGEVVIEHMNIWGRCGSGQAILLDYVISEICFDIGILEGQENYKYWIE